MKNYIILANNRQKYLVMADSETNAKIKFSQNLPSLKIRNIEVTEEHIFNIIS